MVVMMMVVLIAGLPGVDRGRTGRRWDSDDGRYSEKKNCQNPWFHSSSS
jgi:hypothetical protein